jgi:hypothetical protein
MNARLPLLALAATTLLSLQARAEEMAPAPSAAATPAAEGTPGQDEPPDAAATFQDRDGDGIQDGQEHRFRRHGKGAPGRGGSGLGGGMMRRGQGGSAGKGACPGGGR